MKTRIGARAAFTLLESRTEFIPFSGIRERNQRRSALRRAFTLLELLVVVAILAILAGGLVVSYGGLDEQAGHGMDASNSAAVDRAVRTFATLHGQHPDRLDSLLVNGSSPAPLNRLHGDAVVNANLTSGTLTAPEIAALGRIGVTRVIDLDGSLYTDTSTYPNHTDLGDVAVNNMFLEPPAGFGVERPFTSSGGALFLGAAVPLRTKLRVGLTDRVVVFGLGKGSTMGDQSVRGALSSIPFSKVGRGQYGRYLLLFQFRVSGTVPVTNAYFIGALDAHGHTIDDAYDEYHNGTR